MKKTLLKNTVLTIALMFASFNLSAQSVLDAQVFGFELGSETTVANGSGATTGCYFPTASQGVLTFSSEQKASGMYSLKINGSSTSAVDYSVQIGNSTSLAASKTSLAAGKYDLKAKVYIVSNPPATIPVSFAADATLGNVFKNIVLTIPEGTPTGQWVEISALDSTITAMNQAKVTLKFPRTATMAAGSATVLYVDDFRLTPSSPSGVKKLSALDAKVTINRTSKSLTINSITGSEVNIYSISGELLKTCKNIPSYFQTSVADFNKGLYIVKVSNNGSAFVEKIQL